MTARDQMVRPWQLPVADVAVTTMGYKTLRGEAFALGERAPLAVLDAPASGRMAVGEALTNIAAARIAKLGDVKLSANWMAAAGLPGEDARLFDTVRGVSDLCPAGGWRRSRSARIRSRCKPLGKRPGRRSRCFRRCR